MQTHGHLPLVCPSARQQDVTVPALSRSSLSRPVLCLVPVQLCPYCPVSFILTTSLVESASFFFSLFPFSLPPLHYITLALTHHQGLMALPPFVPHGHPEQTHHSDHTWWTSADAPEAFAFAFQRNESGHCATGDVGISGAVGATVKTLLCYICCSPLRQLSVISP